MSFVFKLTLLLILLLYQILELLPPKPSVRRQHLLFTATLTPAVEAFKDFLGRQRLALVQNAPLPSFDFNETQSAHTAVPSQYVPVMVNVNPTEAPVKQLQQLYIFVPHHVKFVYLVHLLSTEFNNETAMVFTKTCQ